MSQSIGDQRRSNFHVASWTVQSRSALDSCKRWHVAVLIVREVDVGIPSRRSHLPKRLCFVWTPL